MPLTIDSLYAPMNDFFLSHFGTGGATGAAVFRLDRFGIGLSDQDFSDPNHPAAGYVPEIAREKGSTLFNYLPASTADGLRIVFTQSSVDDTYFFLILARSLPFIPAGADSQTQQAVISGFSALKAEALRVWTNVRLESSTGLMFQYRPSLVTPENWYDKSKGELWTPQTFQITDMGAAGTDAPAGQLWRLKVSDSVMQNVLQLQAPAQGADGIGAPVGPVFVSAMDNVRAAVVQPSVPAENVAVQRAEIARPALEMQATPMVERAALVQPIDRFAGNVRAVDAVQPAAEVSSVALHDAYLHTLPQVDLRQRILVNQYVGENAPTQPAKTDSISVSFEYCLLTVTRPWYTDVFVNDTSWCIPAVAKGDLTRSDAPGNFALLPVGCVAIRNLNIQANWDADDVANANNATNFGPFIVDSAIVDGKVSHQGIQIVGWLLQQIGPLPPNDYSPIPVPAPAPTVEPDQVVEHYYELIGSGNLDAAWSLLSPRRQALVDKQSWQDGFQTTRAVGTRDVSLTSTSDGTAVVALTINSTDGTDAGLVTKQFQGTWTLVKGDIGWQLDQPDIQLVPS